MNATLDFAERIHSFKFALVLLSSSIIPILTVFNGNPKIFSTLEKISSVNATSSGPCILGFTMYTEPFKEFRIPEDLDKSCIAIIIVHIASIKPSPTSLPELSNTLGLVIKWPTFLFNIKDLPFKIAFVPSVFIYSISLLSLLLIFLPAFSIFSVRSPFIKPSQFL